MFQIKCAGFLHYFSEYPNSVHVCMYLYVTNLTRASVFRAPCFISTNMRYATMIIKRSCLKVIET